jgi:hypothetical protein
MLPVTAAKEIDYPAADARLLVAIRDDAETTIQVIHRGIAVIGLLLAHSSVEIEDGTIGADSVTDIGFFLGEVGDLAGSLLALAAQCRHETSDWVGPCFPLNRTSHEK